MKKRNCRKTDIEREQHDRAIRVRKMTDAQLCEYLDGLGVTRAEPQPSKEEIITAYDETVDFCIGLRREFSTGSLAWSESGRDHFVDVRGLFQLDLAAAALSGLALAAWLVIKRKAAVRPFRFRGRGPGFWGCAGLGALFLLVGGLAAADFQRAFVLFHALFFPGKDNWIFDARADQVILILPEAFFRNCAILILALIVLACAGVILADLRRRKR